MNHRNSPDASKPELSSGHAYARPQLVRLAWISLNGVWDFAEDAAHAWVEPADVDWCERIVVPFSPETRASGLDRRRYLGHCWYRRTFGPPPLDGGRLWLHFGAVDHIATVWIDGVLVGNHTGGYTPFRFDITHCVHEGEPLTIVVCARDDPHDLAKPRGKQDWQLEPHSIWYPRTTGIWQTVWIERVPVTWIDSIRWESSLIEWNIGCEVALAGELRDGLRLRVRLSLGDRLLAEDTYLATGAEIVRRISLADPGIDDSRNELLWSPEQPRLIAATLELLDGEGRSLDRVESYTAVRSVGVAGDRFLLNGRPYQLRLVLDQGYWPETGLTPPGDDALRKDVELARTMGFNGVRKHQKIEDPRYLYWADVLGLLVWEEMPSAYRFTIDSIEYLVREWLDVVRRDFSHPCIVAWVPFNESWGVPNLPDNPAHRDYVRALYHLTRTLDPQRPVVGNDGWESVTTDMVGIHDYDANPVRLAERYYLDERLATRLKSERPGGRRLVLDGHPPDLPLILSEFGGIACSESDTWTWGYSRCETGDELRERYERLLDAVHSLRVFSGFCYTQFADTYQEANGLLKDDRTPKFPLHLMARATLGVSRR